MPTQTAQNILDMDFRISLSATSPWGTQLPCLGQNIKQKSDSRDHLNVISIKGKLA